MQHPLLFPLPLALALALSSIDWSRIENYLVPGRLDDESINQKRESRRELSCSIHRINLPSVRPSRPAYLTHMLTNTISIMQQIP